MPSINSVKIAQQTMALAQADGGPATFRNQLDKKFADTRPLFSMCYSCYGQRVHKNHSYYLKPTEKGQAKISGKWHFAPTLREAYLRICEDSNIAMAGDFHVELGPDFFLYYTCPECGEFPVQPKHWLRTLPQATKDKPGGTTGGQGTWRCPKTGCLTAWTWSKGGAKRCLVLPDLAGREFSDIQDMNMARCP